MKRVCIFIMFLSLSSLSLYSETVRGIIKGFSLASGSENPPITLNLEDLLVIMPPEEPELYLGIELELRIPAAVQRYRDSFVFYLYSNVNPVPEAETRNYNAERALFEIIPPIRRAFYQLPLKINHGLASSVGTSVLNRIILPKDYPLLLTILPVMKGIPSEVLKSSFEVIIRPILAPLGHLSLKINTPDTPSQPYNLFIDEESVSLGDSDLPLAPGIHNLKIESDYYRNKYLSFTIEKGVVTELSLELELLIPQIIVEAPRGTAIFLDGEKFNTPTGVPTQISEGAHTILFRLGDHSISKKFTLQKGETKTISLFLDILIQDN